jgi:hypothetical protein
MTRIECPPFFTKIMLQAGYILKLVGVFSFQFSCVTYDYDSLRLSEKGREKRERERECSRQHREMYNCCSTRKNYLKL